MVIEAVDAIVTRRAVFTPRRLLQVACGTISRDLPVGGAELGARQGAKGKGRGKAGERDGGGGWSDESGAVEGAGGKRGTGAKFVAQYEGIP